MNSVYEFNFSQLITIQSLIMFEKFSAMDISASGLSAERLRMEVTANNIANANTTQTESGDPYRRKTVVFSAALDQVKSGYVSRDSLSGVQVLGVQADTSDFPVVHDEHHPHAVDGVLRLPNVKIPEEMVDLITASRAYEANLKAMSTFKEMVEQSLTLLQGGR